MAGNVDLLTNGLKDYINCLHTHNSSLQEDFRELSALFAALQPAYEGQAAETFKASWMATARWFEEYIDQTVLLGSFLEERVSWLEQDK
ncbi:hypothetical protein F0L74_23715 [Chitinophaga agrisoli]|uniref:WXG100 family type VII secretion target n=1 Tax=Chitinophaga agrisoli TaxID=2607653 RepID=A0A5B2VLS5_9BACT|nr:hypothetical protein [Chitinophaga agrisoli]KAA2239217.1 hypothetical protein F0L74_23715 [Chitinophaga agrisoli]